MIFFRTLFCLLFIIKIELYAQQSLKWKFKTQNRVYSSPVVEKEQLFIGSGDGNLYAINTNTGKQIWRYPTQGAVHSTPLLVNELVYFASADGNLYAINKKDGTLQWEFSSKGEKKYDLWDYYLSSPIHSEDVIYWGSGDGNIYAIHSTTGQLKWSFLTNGVVHATPTLSREHVYIGSFDGNLYCLEKEKGTLVWKFKTVGAKYFPKGEIQKGALLKDNILYFGSRDYNIYAIDATTGTGIWNMKEPSGWVIATPIEYKEMIYFGTSDAHLLYALKEGSGEVVWKTPVPMRVYGAAAVFNDGIYFGTFDGKVIGVDYTSGKIKWEFQTESSRENYHLIYTKEGHFRSDFELYGNDFKKSEDMIHSLGSVLSSPVIANGVIYFGSSDGYIYAVNLE